MNYNCNLNLDMALLSAVDSCRMHVLWKCCHKQFPLHFRETSVSKIANNIFIISTPCNYLWHFYLCYFEAISEFSVRKGNKKLEHEMEAAVFSKSTLEVTDLRFFWGGGGCANSQYRCANHIILQNVWRKLHENERIWSGGARLWRPLDPPLSWQLMCKI